MTVNLQELDDFISFARQRIDAESSELSVEECVRLWRHQLERADVISSVMQGIQDDDKGLGLPLADAFGEVRRQLGIGQ